MVFASYIIIIIIIIIVYAIYTNVDSITIG